ncbi:MAG: recombinase family protein [Methylocella sp.]|nr:MAG: hypothetical protein DLM68_18360 [Hyphomicrobiales bacterium]
MEKKSLRFLKRPQRQGLRQVLRPRRSSSSARIRCATATACCFAHRSPLGRSVKVLVTRINEPCERGVGFVSIAGTIDTRTPTGSFIFHITAAAQTQ